MRLQGILSELEQACSNGDRFDVQLLRDMHSLTRLLHESGFSVETVREGSKLVVEVKPLAAVEEYEWAA